MRARNRIRTNSSELLREQIDRLLDGEDHGDGMTVSGDDHALSVDDPVKDLRAHSSARVQGAFF